MVTSAGRDDEGYVPALVGFAFLDVTRYAGLLHLTFEQTKGTATLTLIDPLLTRGESITGAGFRISRRDRPASAMFRAG